MGALDTVPLRALSHEQQTNGMHARAMNIAELWPTVLSQIIVVKICYTNDSMYINYSI